MCISLYLFKTDNFSLSFFFLSSIILQTLPNNPHFKFSKISLKKLIYGSNKILWEKGTNQTQTLNTISSSSPYSSRIILFKKELFLLFFNLSWTQSNSPCHVYFHHFSTSLFQCNLPTIAPTPPHLHKKSKQVKSDNPPSKRRFMRIVVGIGTSKKSNSIETTLYTISCNSSNDFSPHKRFESFPLHLYQKPLNHYRQPPHLMNHHRNHLSHLLNPQNLFDTHH